MELNAAIKGRKACLDTNILIYLLEGSAAFARPLAQLKASIEQQSARFVVSSLAFAEILPPLAAKGDKAAIEKVNAFLAGSGAFEIAPADMRVCIQAGLLRGTFKMKTPDAIHVATALLSGCDCILTNDGGMRTPDGLEVLMISRFA